MKNKIAAALSALLTVAFLPSYIPDISVSAEGQALPVELTSAQTLALYGSSIPATYYDGASVRTTNFEFYKSSKTLASAVERVFSSGFYGVSDPSNLFAFGDSSYYQRYWCQEWVSSINQGDWLSSNSGWIFCDAIQPYEFLIYRAPLSLGSVNQSDADFQINLDFSIALDGVERFCAINAYSIGFASSFDIYALPSIRCSNLRSTLKYFDTSSSVLPFGITSDCYSNDYSGSSFGVAFHPVSLPDLTNIVDNHWVYWNDMNYLFPSPVFSMCYFDSGTLNSSVSLSSMYWDIFASAGGITHEDSYSISNPTFTTQYTYLMLMCPVVWGDVSQPEPEPGTPDYSSSLDSIISNTSSTNTKLDQILIKLDLIYQQMQQDGGTADIDAPDVIGLKPTAKQRVLSGMSELDSTFEDVSPEDLPTDAFQGFSSGWSAIKAIFPNGLWSIYMLSLVGGIVAWIIYGKRS